MTELLLVCWFSNGWLFIPSVNAPVDIDAHPTRPGICRMREPNGQLLMVYACGACGLEHRAILSHL